MTTNELYERLSKQALEERGSPQVWHEADIDGHHLYMSDTSFGDGPIFRCDKYAWQIAYSDAPITVDTTPAHLAEALALAERATWVSRFENLDTSLIESKPGAPPRKLVVSVKHTDGDWETYEAIEIKMAQPVVLFSDTAGVMTIKGEEQAP